MPTNRIKDLYLITMYILAFVAVVLLLTADFDMLWIYLLISTLWVFSFTSRNLYIYNTDKYIRWVPITYIAEIMLLFILTIMGGGVGTKILLYITLIDCYIVWGTGWGLAGIVIYFLFHIGQYIQGGQLDLKGLFLVIGTESPVFFLVSLIAFLVERVLKNTRLVELSVKDLGERELRLKLAYEELSKAYRSLEEMSVIKERNRIAREIHDTVGHTITTVIVEMEAGRMLVDKNPELAMEKYNMAQQQALKSLEELRRSVRMLAEEKQNVSLRQALLGIISETETHTGITIKSIIDVPDNIGKEYAPIVVRALKEGISNGIRHGKATAYFFKFTKESTSLVFQLQDNGKGCSIVKQGFGLQNMNKVICSLGGSVEFHSEPGEGFEIKITLPLEKDKEEVQHA